MRRKVLFLISILVTFELQTTESNAQPVGTPVSFRNVLRQGSIVAQFEQLDGAGVVVGLTTQRIANGGIATITVNTGTRFNIRVLPEGGGGPCVFKPRSRS